MAMVVVALGVAVEAGTSVVSFDRGANRAVHAHAAEPVTGSAFVLSALGSTFVLVGVVLAASLGLAVRGRRRASVALISAYVVTDATVALMKVLVARPRPGESLTHAGGFSFPSGHAATSMAVYGSLAFVFARARRGLPRVAFALAGGALVTLIGLSRIYLGVHYPSDVVAGWITGAAITIAAWTIASRLRPRRAPAPA
ncbi:MAG TPA: phosphatase PAP2 family protein [Thermoleophilaceae bacterium]|jgi:undecaprenyl-diphosphatase